MNERIAKWVTEHVATMTCAWIFLAIGIGSLIGVVTGNTTLALLFGAVSSYILQLVLLPIIMVAQKGHAEAQAKRADLHAEKHNERLRNMGTAVAALLRAKKLEYNPADAEWRGMLKRALIENRSNQPSGSGDAYWESVVETVEDFLQAKTEAGA